MSKLEEVYWAGERRAQHWILTRRRSLPTHWAGLPLRWGTGAVRGGLFRSLYCAINEGPGPARTVLTVWRDGASPVQWSFVHHRAERTGAQPPIDAVADAVAGESLNLLEAHLLAQDLCDTARTAFAALERARE